MRSIMYISQYSGIGGGETYLCNLIKGMKNNTDDRLFLVTRTEGELNNRCSELGIKNLVYDFGTLRKRVINLLKLPFILFRNTWFIQKYKPDLIHVNEINEVFLFIIPVIYYGIPVIWTCHGQWYRFSFWQRFIINRYISKIIAVSESVFVNLKNNCLRNDILQKISIGIELSRFAPKNKRSHADNTKFVVGMIGRFQEIKGQDIFVKAAFKLLNKRQDVEFEIVGGNPFGDKAAMEFAHTVKSYIDNYKIGSSVRMVGHRSDIDKILSDFHILVLPSRNESFGIVLLEAMAAECPIVASACDGPLEIIKNFEDGLLFERENVDDLCEKIEVILDNSDLRKYLIKNAYIKVCGQYSLELMIENTIKVYSEVKQ